MTTRALTTITGEEQIETLIDQWMKSVINGDTPDGDLHSKIQFASRTPLLTLLKPRSEDPYTDDLIPDVDDETGEEFYYWEEHGSEVTVTPSPSNVSSFEWTQKEIESQFGIKPSQTLINSLPQDEFFKKGRKRKQKRNVRKVTGGMIPGKDVSKEYKAIIAGLKRLSTYDDLNLDDDDLDRLHGIATGDNKRVKQSTHYDVFPTGDGSMICRPTHAGSQARMKNHDFGAGSHGPLILGDLPLITWPSGYGLIDKTPTDKVVTPAELEFDTSNEALDKMMSEGQPVSLNLPAKGIRMNQLDAVEGKHEPRTCGRPWSQVMRCTHWDLTSSKSTNPFVIVDIDRKDALDVYRKTVDAGLAPEASYVIINQVNGHVQLGYLVPPATRDDARQMGLYRKVKEVLVYTFGGDVCETGRRCRSPYYVGANGTNKRDGWYKNAAGVRMSNRLEVRIPDAGKTGGCRIWSLYGLKDFLSKCGALEKYDHWRKTSRGGKLTSKGVGSIDDGRRTALDPSHIKGEVIPCGLRNITTLRVVNYHIWTGKITNEDKLVELICSELTYDSEDSRDVFGEAAVRGVVHAALKNHKAKYTPYLDPQSPLFHTNLVVDDKGNCNDKTTGRFVCTFKELEKYKDKFRKNSDGRDEIAVENGRKGGSKNTESQKTQRALNLKGGVKAKIETKDKNLEAVRRAFDVIDSTPESMVKVRKDGRKIKISRKAAVWNAVESDETVKMSRKTCDRHYEEIVAEKQAMARAASEDVNEIAFGRREQLTWSEWRPSMLNRSALALSWVNKAVVDVMVPKMVESGHAREAITVMDAVLGVQGVVFTSLMDIAWGEATQRTAMDCSEIGVITKEILFDGGLKKMKDAVAAAGYEDEFHVPMRDDPTRRWDWWTYDGQAPQLDWSDPREIDDWACLMEASSRKLLSKLRSLTWFDFEDWMRRLYKDSRKRVRSHASRQ